ncbi:glycosyltransferase family 2 protein [Mucilaginibacter ginsenosidivorax]|uniref:Glycosyltransferase n=1 Tax=Mucilaginibacter ginsenosidivorax TaxID=862126 RepID=A0A5B8W4T0_9SPHI|nr:glycosyltransferase family 2 protein [Mucilaginibacter ginsenosidivorax]QEC77926.1 glycosyltransferase [Mucilaginibacter ginsenosidivorax]
MALKSANQPKISIIIPTYNAAGTLANCLDSIVNQDYTDIEVWLMDGLSTDDTLSVIKQYQAAFPYINFVSEKDNGIYDAMNKGIARCNGDWLYFLGSDDTLYNNSVISLVANKIGEISDKVVYGNVLMRGQNQWNLDNVVFNGEYDMAKMISTNICHQAIFYHKSIFRLFGHYDLSYIASADQEFNLRCYARTSFSYIDLIIANFFVGGYSTGTVDHKFHRERGAMLVKYFGSRIFTGPFTPMRLYLKQAALSKESSLNLFDRIYSLSAYIKLKAADVLMHLQKRRSFDV